MASTPTAPAVEAPIGIAADLHGLSRLELRALVDAGTVKARTVGSYIYVDMASLAAVKPIACCGRHSTCKCVPAVMMGSKGGAAK
jgi:hypothetical protein